MDKIEKIRKEIERRKGYISVTHFAEELLSFLDTLSEEDALPCWKKVHTYTEELREGDMGKMLLDLSIGKGERKTKIALPDKVVDLLSEEPDKSLEEAAKHHSEQYRPHWPNQVRPAYDSFIAGAKWTQDQFEKNRLAHCDKLTKEEYDRETDFALGIIEGEYRQPTFTDAINYGMRVMKEHLMKEVVESVVIDSGFDDGIAFVTINIPDKKYDRGDKVKLIVIKED